MLYSYIASLIQPTLCHLDFTSPQCKLQDTIVSPPSRHFQVLRPKLVKVAADGFEIQTTKPSILGFEN
jgi:hypothetical protein